jgi:hypothetical protein
MRRLILSALLVLFLGPGLDFVPVPALAAPSTPESPAVVRRIVQRRGAVRRRGVRRPTVRRPVRRGIVGHRRTI